MPPPRFVAVLVLSGLGLGGCHARSEAASSHAPAGPSCALVTAEMVNAKLGFQLSGPNVDRGPGATICTYDDPSDQTQSAAVRIGTGATPESFARTRSGFATHGETVTDVPGLGEQAYSAILRVANVTSTTLVARHGSNEVLITTTAPADHVPALMTAVLALL